MPHTSRTVLVREGLKVIAVVVIAVVLGVGVGLGLSRASGNDEGPPGAPMSAAAAVDSTPATSTAKDTTTSTSTGAPAVTRPTGPLDLGDDLALRVTAAEFVPAQTAAGRERKRGRLAVRVSVKNNGSTPVTAPVLKLVVREGGAVVRPDPAGREDLGALLADIAAGGTAKGELHFETTGAPTDALTDAGEVLLRYGPRAVTVELG